MPTTIANESPYEAELRTRRDLERGQQSRNQMLSEHRDEVETAIALGRKATRLEAQIAQFDDESTGFRERARLAKRAFWACVAVVATYAFIWTVDFWMATPDVAEYLANKSMSLVVSLNGTGAETTVDGASVTPVWLRITIGMLLTTAFLLLTIWVKAISSETRQREEMQALQPGDDNAYRGIRRQVLLKRASKVGYMVVAAGLFYYLYTFDLSRAKIMEETVSTSQEEIEWQDLGITISGGELTTDEAVETSESEDSSVDESNEWSATDLAKASLVIYAILWFLHGIILLTPQAKMGDDSHLAHFNRGRAGKSVDNLRDHEEPLLRSVTFRISESGADVRDALIREAQPLAKRINEVAERDIMVVSDSPIDQGQDDDSTDSAPEASTTGSDLLADVGESGRESRVSGATPSGQRIGGNPRNEEPEDPYAAIFGV